MSGLSEERVVTYWVRQASGRADLVTEEDGPVTVLSPGRRNDDHGADFRDAVLATRRGLLVGDIEVHTASSGWRAHRHHRDPAYNRVILHVVYRHDTAKEVVMENGRTVPTLALEHFINATGIPVLAPHLLDTTSFMPCRGAAARRNPEKIGKVLDAAGDDRFCLKVDAYRRRMNGAEPGQVLYSGIMEALGYSRNREPMRELAEVLPLNRLETVIQPAADDETCLATWQGWLLGTAGLLPSQRTLRPGGEIPAGGWAERLERA
ncbi:MAG: DUF2851 family protein, partial [Dehalococcoidales bacterium]|nr:DUF2851 family protein [Dehalococcoidales bacterium]